MNVWRLVAHHYDPDFAIEWYQRRRRIALGWGSIGDITQKRFTSAQDISDAIKRTYPILNNAFSGGQCLWNFYDEIKEGDLVILSTGKSRALVMEVQGRYEWKAAKEPPSMEDYRHQRKAHVIPDKDPDELWKRAGAGPAMGYNIRWALIKMAKSFDN
ncbi:hypothetical protein L0337_38205 [candidate division KSB1 bacterium]|nr:hypothetical protein [candidate division KSB1 bacterium]